MREKCDYNPLLYMVEQYFGKQINKNFSLYKILIMKVFLLLLLLFFPLNSKVAESHQVDVTLSYESGYTSKSLYINGKKEAVYKSRKKKPIRLTKVEKDMQNVFFEQLKYLESWGGDYKISGGYLRRPLYYL